MKRPGVDPAPIVLPWFPDKVASSSEITNHFINYSSGFFWLEYRAARSVAVGGASYEKSFDDSLNLLDIHRIDLMRYHDDTMYFLVMKSRITNKWAWHGQSSRWRWSSNRTWQRPRRSPIDLTARRQRMQQSQCVVDDNINRSHKAH